MTVLLGRFILKGNVIASVNKHPDKQVTAEICTLLHIHHTESIDGNFFYWFKQLIEISIKALSASINDPDTAVISLGALFLLYADRLCHFPSSVIADKSETPRLFLKSLEFATIFTETILPRWDYGKNDRIVCNELGNLLTLLFAAYPKPVLGNLLNEVQRDSREKYLVNTLWPG